MSAKKILSWACGLVPALSISVGLASCGCSPTPVEPDEPTVETITVSEPTNKQFKVARYSNKEEYTFTLSDFKLSRELIEGEKITGSAVLVSDDGDIPLSLESSSIKNKVLTITLSSKEWDELIGIQSSDTPYTIKKLSLKCGNQVLLNNGTGYSTIIKTAVVAKVDDGILDISGMTDQTRTLYLPGGPSLPVAEDDEYFMWINQPKNANVPSSIYIYIDFLNEAWADVSCDVDDIAVEQIEGLSEDKFYIHPEVYDQNVEQRTEPTTRLGVYFWLDAEHTIELYSNDGINPNDDIIWQLTWTAK